MRDSAQEGGSKRIKVNADELIQALQNHGFDFTYFLELETGEVGMYFDGMLNGEEVDEDFDIDVFLDPDLHCLIRGIDSSESFEVMEEFIDELPPGRAKSKLTEAISGRKPFRRFKDALFDFDDLREEWFAFEHRAYVDIARKWLKDNGIDAEIIDPRSHSSGSDCELF